MFFIENCILKKLFGMPRVSWIVIGPKLLWLVFIVAHSVLYRATLDVKMTFGLLLIEWGQNERILMKTHRIVAVCMKRYRQTPDRKIKEKILSTLFRVTFIILISCVLLSNVNNDLSLSGHVVAKDICSLSYVFYAVFLY